MGGEFFAWQRIDLQSPAVCVGKLATQSAEHIFSALPAGNKARHLTRWT